MSLPIVLSGHPRASKSSFTAKEVCSLLQLGLVWGEIRNNKIRMDKITNKITCPAGRVTFLTLWAMLMLPRSRRSEKPPPIIWRAIFGSAVKQMCLCVVCVPESGIVRMDSVPDFLADVWNSKYQASPCCLIHKHIKSGREGIFLVREEGRMGAERKQRLNLMCFSFVCSKTNVVSQISVESLVSSIFLKKDLFCGYGSTYL